MKLFPETFLVRVKVLFTTMYRLASQNKDSESVNVVGGGLREIGRWAGLWGRDSKYVIDEM